MRCALALVCLLPLACSKPEPPSPAARGARAARHEPRMPAYFRSQAAANEVVEPTAAASQPASDQATAGAASRPASAPAAAAEAADRAAPPDPEVFDSAFAGVRIRKPRGWRFMSEGEVRQARDAARQGDLLGGAGLRFAPPPLVSITRHPADHAGFSPSIVVTSRMTPDEALAPRELLEKLLPMLTAGFAGLTPAPAPAATKVGGKDAAEVRVRYAAGAAKTPVETRLVLARRGSTLLVFALTGAVKGPDRCDAELKAALGSVEIR